jgi:hypothetical protein
MQNAKTPDSQRRMQVFIYYGNAGTGLARPKAGATLLYSRVMYRVDRGGVRIPHGR